MELPEQAFGLKGRLRGQGPPEGLVPVGREGAARILAWPGEVFVEDRIEHGTPRLGGVELCPPVICHAAVHELLGPPCKVVSQFIVVRTQVEGPGLEVVVGF